MLEIRIISQEASGSTTNKLSWLSTEVQGFFSGLLGQQRKVFFSLFIFRCVCLWNGTEVGNISTVVFACRKSWTEYVRNRIVFFPLQEGCSHYVNDDSRSPGCPVPGQNIILYANECVVICTGERERAGWDKIWVRLLLVWGTEHCFGVLVDFREILTVSSQHL